MRLLVVVTGSVGAAFLPYWANWLRINREDVDPTFVLTASAERFVSLLALEQVTGGPVLRDAWPDEGLCAARHVDLQQSSDAVLVYPATLDYISRLANGLCDRPSLLAIACTDAPVVVAPSLPPGGRQSQVYEEHLRRLHARRNFQVAAPVPVLSAATRQYEAAGAAPLPGCVELLDASLARGGSRPAPAPGEGAAQLSAESRRS